MISYIKTNKGLTVIIGGKTFSIAEDSPSYSQVWDAIKNNEPESAIEQLFNTAVAVKHYMQGNVEVKDNKLFYKGELVDNVIAERILEFIALDLPYEPLVKFLERLLANPSHRSINELYSFLQHEALPITDDGHFLGYKGVRDDYMDVYTGEVDNHPGKAPEMPRSKVDDDFRNGCSKGYHVGSLKYACDYGKRVVIVKVDPADVVSVPEDMQFQKLRCCKYFVVCDYEGPLMQKLHDSDAPYNKPNRWDDVVEPDQDDFPPDLDENTYGT